jgi:antitoxin HigA-1
MRIMNLRYDWRNMVKGKVRRPAAHPGELLKSAFLDPSGVSARELADWLHVPNNRLSDIIRGRRAITADTALRLAQRFNTTPIYWMNLQSEYDLAKAAAENDYSDIVSVKDEPRRRKHPTSR